MSYLEQLNQVQRAAVENTEGPVMIIAGAGSGKTRVITYRIAHLINKGIEPHNILALTFTNKAAKEMRERIVSIAGAKAKNIWMGTFHSIFAKILRVEANRLKYPSNFTIYDTDDSKSLIKTIVKELKLDDKLYDTKTILGLISSAKNNLLSVSDYKNNTFVQAQNKATGRFEMPKIYEMYAKRCFNAGAMDFDDLLFKMNILFNNCPDIIQKYQDIFKYVMVDEYQDTNFSQYTIVKKIVAGTRNLCVVGDDAQSIYAFRGADITNILNFEKDYPDLKIFKLEENYRSTKNIVNGANSVIKKNKNQLKKNSFSGKEDGEKINVWHSVSDIEEALKVGDSINSLKDEYQDNPYKKFAVLYRTNAQSRTIEEVLRKKNIPYKIVGGMSFYHYKEIKDIIAYFRVVINPNDEEALKRIINYPKRAIGDTTVGRIFECANNNNISLWDTITNFKSLSNNARGSSEVENFGKLISSFRDILDSKTAFEVAEQIAKNSGILKELYDDKSKESQDRYNNILSLLNGIKEFSELEDIEDHSLNQFIIDVALLTGDEKKDEDDNNKVTLMTIHSSKGLEFQNVYIVGLEENLFPSALSINDIKAIEEERRLFYVAITRAEKRLCLSYATSRYKFGSLINCEPSRFLYELDPALLVIDGKAKIVQKQEYAKQAYNKPVTNEKPVFAPKNDIQLSKGHHISSNFVPSDTSNLKVGMSVEHERFGFGKVISMQQAGSDIKATVIFNDYKEEKHLLLKFAKLRII